MSRGAAAAEWRKSWRSVALSLLGLTCAPSTLPVYTLGLFVAPLHAQFGWSHAAIQAAILFSTGLGVAGGPLAGWLVRAHGLRTAALCGLAGMALSLIACATMTGALWQFYGAYAMMALLGAGANAVAWSTLVAANFDRSRGLALGIALSGTGLSAIIMPQIAAAGLAHADWRMSYFALAAFVVLVVLPLCAAFIPAGTRYRARPDEAVAEVAGMELGAVIRTGRFWLIGLSTALIYLAVGGLIPNVVPALNARGVSSAEAVSIMGILGMAVIAGRVLVGALLDRVWAPLVASLVLLPAAASCLLLATDQPVLVYGVAAAGIGLVTGMEFDMMAFLIGRYFGMHDYSRIFGRLYMFLAVAAGSAPMTFGAIFDRTGSYDIPVMLASALLVSGAVSLLLLGRYPDSQGAGDCASVRA
jgi:MFS family permease